MRGGLQQGFPRQIGLPHQQVDSAITQLLCSCNLWNETICSQLTYNPPYFVTCAKDEL
jgi:hypothetical protein